MNTCYRIKEQEIILISIFPLPACRAIFYPQFADSCFLIWHKFERCLSTHIFFCGDFSPLSLCVILDFISILFHARSSTIKYKTGYFFTKIGKVF